MFTLPTKRALPSSIGLVVVFHVVSAVTQVVDEEVADGNTDVSLCVMQMSNTGSYLGAAGHPNNSGHTELANTLVPHIKELMGW